MKLVLQCAMCGTHHAVGTRVCATCRASGLTQLRLVFECPACSGLGLNPTCEACPPVVPLDLDDDLIVAEEVTDEPLTLDPDAPEFDGDLVLPEFDEAEFELIDDDIDAVIVDLTEDMDEEEDD